MKTKLTLVSVYHNGHRAWAFCQAPTIDGKTVVPTGIVNNLCNDLGASSRGATITIG